MASAARTASRAFLRSTPVTSSFRPAARSTRFAVPHLRGSTRGYASDAGSQKSSSSFGIWAVGLGALGAGGVYFYLNGASPKAPFVPTQADYQKVYDAVAKRLADETDYDDGSYGPVSLRLLFKVIHGSRCSANAEFRLTGSCSSRMAR